MGHTTKRTGHSFRGVIALT